MSASLCASPALQTGAARFVLQRTGSRPLRFEGRLLACQNANDASGWAEIRLALYECPDGYVVEVRCMPEGHGVAQRCWCAASLHGTVAAACGAFEAASPEVECPDSDPAFGTVDALARAIARHVREQAQIRVFRAAIGKFLFDLCSTASMTSGNDFAAHWPGSPHHLTILSPPSGIVHPSQRGHARLLRRTT